MDVFESSGLWDQRIYLIRTKFNKVWISFCRRLRLAETRGSGRIQQASVSTLVKKMIAKPLKPFIPQRTFAWFKHAVVSLAFKQNMGDQFFFELTKFCICIGKAFEVDSRLRGRVAERPRGDLTWYERRSIDFRVIFWSKWGNFSILLGEPKVALAWDILHCTKNAFL